MFQFPSFAHLTVYYPFRIVGYPIRTSSDQRLCASPRSFSQLTASFIAGWSLGILQAPLLYVDALNSLITLLFRLVVSNTSKNSLTPRWNQSDHDNQHKQNIARHCSRKEVFQPHLPVRLPCYDLAPVTEFTLTPRLKRSFRSPRLPWLDGRCVQGPGTYSPRHG